MTEDHAKTKWCPMTRWTKTDSGTFSNLPDESSDRCIASECMQWWANGPADGFCGLGKVPKSKP